jgi:putative iron-regulated protein
MNGFRFTSRRSLAAAVFASLTAGSSLVACTSSDPNSGAGSSVVTSSSDAAEASVVTGYADMAEGAYESSVTAATALLDAVKALADTPSKATLDGARQQWLTARGAYLSTEVFRFSASPIDGASDNPDVTFERRINAWPIDETYVDGTSEVGPIGVVNDVESFPTLTKQVLLDANQKDGENNVVAGWHVIEYVLWGNATLPGNRALGDFTTTKTAKRMRTFLQLVTEQLVADLTKVQIQWKAGSAYRATLNANTDAALSGMLRGIGTLSAAELAGARLGFALESKDPADEASSYSGNTNADLRNSAVAIRGLYLGELGGKKVTSVSSLVAAADPTADTKLRAELEATVQAASSLPGPFGEVVVGEADSPGPLAIKAAIEAFQQQGDTIVAAGNALGLQVSIQP